MWKLIFAQLVAKHPGVPKAVLELLAKKLEPKVTEESQIEGVINDFETNSPISIKDYADFVQREGDTRVGDAKKKWDAENKKPDPANPNPNPTQTEKKDDEMPTWAKGLVESVKTLQNEVAGNKTKSTLDGLVAKAKEKGIPEKYARKYIIGEDFDEDKALTEIDAEWTEIKQSIINSEVGEGKVFTGGKIPTKAVSDAITKFTKTNVEAAATKTKE